MSNKYTFLNNSFFFNLISIKLYQNLIVIHIIKLISSTQLINISYDFIWIILVLWLILCQYKIINKKKEEKNKYKY